MALLRYNGAVLRGRRNGTVLMIRVGFGSIRRSDQYTNSSETVAVKRQLIKTHMSPKKEINAVL